MGRHDLLIGIQFCVAPSGVCGFLKCFVFAQGAQRRSFGLEGRIPQVFVCLNLAVGLFLGEWAYRFLCFGVGRPLDRVFALFTDLVAGLRRAFEQWIILFIMGFMEGIKKMRSADLNILH